MSKSFELTYALKSGAGGVVREVVPGDSEYNARALLRAKYGNGQEVRILDGHEVRDDRRDGQQGNRR